MNNSSFNKIIGKIEDEMILEIRAVRGQIIDSKKWIVSHNDDLAKHNLYFNEGLEFGIEKCIDILRKYYRGYNND